MRVAEEAMNPVDLEVGGRALKPSERAIAAPGPLGGIVDEVCPDRIERDVAAELDQVCLSGDVAVAVGPWNTCPTRRVRQLK